MKALAAALGPFQAAGQPTQQQAADSEYDPGTPKRSGALYEAFRQERERALQERNAALAAVREPNQAYATELKAWYRERFRQERTNNLTGALRADRGWTCSSKS